LQKVLSQLLLTFCCQQYVQQCSLKREWPKLHLQHLHQDLQNLQMAGEQRGLCPELNGDAGEKSEATREILNFERRPASSRICWAEAVVDP
jgi:hypothetical protein